MISLSETPQRVLLQIHRWARARSGSLLRGCECSHKDCPLQPPMLHLEEANGWPKTSSRRPCPQNSRRPCWESSDSKAAHDWHAVSSKRHPTLLIQVGAVRSCVESERGTPMSTDAVNDYQRSRSGSPAPTAQRCIRRYSRTSWGRGGENTARSAIGAFAIVSRQSPRMSVYFDTGRDA